jgi:hypothetical protein
VTCALGVVPLVLSGCAEMAQDARARDLCRQYDQLVTAAERFEQQDPVQVTADDLRAPAGRVRDELNQVQAVAEGRLDTAVTNLEASLDDLRDAAVDVGEDLRTTVVPLWQEDLEQVAESWAVLQGVVAAQCDG